ncbi:DUF488 family protein (plasmid) [Sinorhizobium meliloti]|nr:DUF488 family protein [Sinorhizobium meliloti]
MSTRRPARPTVRASSSTGSGRAASPREKAGIDLWLKDHRAERRAAQAVSWKPQDWDAFCVAYAEELESGAAQAAVAELREHGKRGR